ncbi:hypothetical protein TNCV_1077711 [Trichonephila clavipes]|uniref:Uncharacterized protein n=1 Tax=Trichonephila clavipes TaxID=2585209 RepID=A0A8X6RMW1_TRICX|nr:hypothetical protein TNCV_1077711 [Trichonephila clavipes]
MTSISSYFNNLEMCIGIYLNKQVPKYVLFAGKRGSSPYIDPAAMRNAAASHYGVESDPWDVASRSRIPQLTQCRSIPPLPAVSSQE